MKGTRVPRNTGSQLRISGSSIMAPFNVILPPCKRIPSEYFQVLSAMMVILLTGLQASGRSFDPICLTQARSQEAKSNHSEPDLEFKVLKIGNDQLEDGTWTDIVTIRSSKGDLVYKTSIEFATKTQANDELKRLSKQAEKAVRRTPEVDKDGKVIGERVLALFPEESAKSRSVRLFYTRANMYLQIESDSMDAVVALEKLMLKASEQR